MTFYFYQSGNKYIIDNENGKKAYYVKKKGLGSAKYHLYDNNDYKLYTLKQKGDIKKPYYDIFFDDEPYAEICCESRFMSFCLKIGSKVGEYVLDAPDRECFKFTKGFKKKNSKDLGTMKMTKVNNINKYELIIDDSEFEIFMLLFPLALEFTFFQD